MNFVNLGGHSGCKILLCEECGKTWVRKVSKDIGYNNRLQEQCKKQLEFPQGEIKAPKILGQGYDNDGLYYFDMEYIQGVTLAEYIKNIEIGKIRGIVDNIVDCFTHLPKDCQNTYSNEEIFAKKISDLRSNLTENNDVIINEALNMLEAHSWHRFETTPCHGDLTLENIIIRNDELYLIDFLDSFYDSCILDIATLFQDVQVMWSYRFNKSVSMNTVIRLMVFRDLLLEKFSKKAENYTIEIYYALLLKLVRIFPYTKDQLTYDFLDRKTEMVMEIIREINKGEKI